MNSFSRRAFMISAATSSLALLAGTGMAAAEDLAKRAKIDARADASLAKLLGTNRHAKALAEKASTILIFPRINEAGIGGKRGMGVLRQGDKSLAYYRTTSLSFGAELGFETHGYVLMFMTHDAAQKFAGKNDHLNIGAQAEVTLFRASLAENFNTLSLKSEIVAFMFDEKGAILDLTLEGTQIHHMNI